MNNFDLIPVHNELMMDSRDIAHVTGKKHTHVSRDISKMLLELYGECFRSPKNGTSYIIKTYKNANNVETTYHLLNQELTLTLLSGYSIKLRNQIVKKWMYLEKEYKQKRVKSIEARNTFTDTLKEHGYTKAYHYIQTTKQMKNKLGITNSKENMSTKELKRIAASEALASAMLDDKYGYSEVNPVCVEASELLQAAVQRKVLTA